MLFHADDGQARGASFKCSTWHCLHAASPPEDKRLNAIFRRRFRLPCSVFLELANEIVNHDLLARWAKKDCIGNDPIDYRLLLLGSLRCVGRSSTFDDTEEFTFVSNEVHRNFFQTFWIAKALFCARIM